MTQTKKRMLALTCLSLAPLSTACSSDEVNLGGGTLTRDLAQLTRCAESPIIEGDVHVASQSDLEQLAGCEEISGRLGIEVFEGADLSPLASLRRAGVLELGASPLEIPEDPVEELAFWEELDAIQAAGYLQSLHGLEALESVDTLYLSYTRVTNLAELESLGQLDTLVATSSTKLHDLHGLEGAAPTFIWITGAPEFETLDGLRMPEASETVIIERVPSFTNIDALANITSLDTLMLTSTGLSSLDPLGALAAAGAILIGDNPRLADLDGLSALQSAGSLDITANPAITALPAFPQLGALQLLRVVDNASLKEVPLDYPALQPQTVYTLSDAVVLSATLVEIGMNPSLERISSPAGFNAVQYFSITQNPALTSVDFGTLQRVDRLSIEGNTALTSVDIGELATVDALNVTGNPLLDASAFDPVLTFSRNVSSQPAPEPGPEGSPGDP